MALSTEEKQDSKSSQDHVESEYIDHTPPQICTEIDDDNDGLITKDEIVLFIKKAQESKPDKSKVPWAVEKLEISNAFFLQ